MRDDDEEGTVPVPFMVVVHEARFSIFYFFRKKLTRDRVVPTMPAGVS